MRKIILYSIFCLAAVACAKNELTEGSAESEAFKQETTPGLYRNSESILIYDKDVHQYAFNSKRHTFMIQNNAQSRYLICELSDAPETGNTVSVEFATKGISNFDAAQLDMQVIKTEAGRHWLFDQATGTGLLIIME